MKIKAETLTTEAFTPFGTFVNAYDIDEGNKELVGYFPDLLEMNLEKKNMCICICHIDPQDSISTEFEIHEHTDECWVLIDGDGVAVFGKPCKDLNKAELMAFYIKKGTAICSKIGTWHSAPFPVENNRLMVVTLLPPKTYEDDMIVQKLNEPVEIIL